MAFADEFLKDVSGHQMVVIRDDGVNRHIRFQRPGTMSMHFDLVTWPGYLCFVGDMGTYVFKRLTDMFEFFRRPAGRDPYAIDLRYWAEKVESADRFDGVSAFSADKFKAEVKDYFDTATEDDDEWPEARKAALWSEIEDMLLGAADEWEHGAWAALRDFQHDDFRFTDWEGDCKEYSHRFLWCCHALRWAIETYDEAKTPAAVA